MARAFNITKKQLKYLYIDKKMNIKDIAKFYKLGTTKSIIRQLNRYKFKIRNSTKKLNIDSKDIIKMSYLYIFGFSIDKIAKKFKLKYSSVRNVLIKNKIMLRLSCKENEFITNNSLKVLKRREYPQLSKDILYKLYIIQNLTVYQVSKKLKIGMSIIKRYLKQYNIPIKGIRYYLIKPKIEFTKEQYEFFDGLIASDGHLSRTNGRKNSAINCKFKYKMFAQYINKYLNLHYNIKKCIHKSGRYKSGQCISYNLGSQNNILFTQERSRWYLNGNKAIPRDFRFSPVSMNILYLCDGTKHGNIITLCTQGLQKDNLENTIVKGLKDIDINSRIDRYGQIVIDKINTIKFLNYIGECPIGCYKHKWFVGKSKRYFFDIPSKEELLLQYRKNNNSIRRLNMNYRVGYTILKFWLNKYGILPKNK